jgi:hypothetical protein
MKPLKRRSASSTSSTRRQAYGPTTETERNIHDNYCYYSGFVARLGRALVATRSFGDDGHDGMVYVDGPADLCEEIAFVAVALEWLGAPWRLRPDVWYGRSGIVVVGGPTGGIIDILDDADGWYGRTGVVQADGKTVVYEATDAEIIAEGERTRERIAGDLTEQPHEASSY